MNNKTIFIIFISIFLLNASMYAQPKSGNRDIKISKVDFIALLDSLPKIPASSEEAFKLNILDFANNFVKFDSTIEKLDVRIKLLTEQLSANNFSMKNRMRSPQAPNGNGPPQGGMPPGGIGPPGGMELPEGFEDIREDMDNVNSAVDKINVLKEKFKSEINTLQDKTNEKLHKTFENDYTAHVDVIDDFLSQAFKLNVQYFMMIKENMKKIDDIERKYDYGSKIKSIIFQSDFIELQIFQAEVVNFLFGISKEFIVIGGKFYAKKNVSHD